MRNMLYVLTLCLLGALQTDAQGCRGIQNNPYTLVNKNGRNLLANPVIMTDPAWPLADSPGMRFTFKGLRGKDMFGIRVNFYGDNEVKIGGIYLGNTKSAINAPGSTTRQVNSPNSLGRFFTKYWVTWSNGKITVGKGTHEFGVSTLMSSQVAGLNKYCVKKVVITARNDVVWDYRAFLTCETVTCPNHPTMAPATPPPTTKAPSTPPPTTKAPATPPPTTKAPATQPPTTKAPATEAPVPKVTVIGSTAGPTTPPTDPFCTEKKANFASNNLPIAEPEMNEKCRFTPKQCGKDTCWCVSKRTGLVKYDRMEVPLTESYDCTSKPRKCYRVRFETISKDPKASYMPLCDSIGQYQPEQCDTKANECWCVKKRGGEVKKSRVSGPATC